MERDKLIKSEVSAMFNTTVETLRHYEKKDSFILKNRKMVTVYMGLKTYSC